MIITRGGVTADFKSFFMSRCAARVVSSALDQDVEHEAVLIDGAPQPVLLASDCDDKASGAGEFHPRALSGRVEDWRAGLGRSLGSLLSRPFVCECPSISTVPRLQSPPRRTQLADCPHYAPPFASCQDLWDLSCRSDFQHVPPHSIAVEQPKSVVEPPPIPSLPAEALSARDSDAVELRAVPAICLAPSYHWAPGPSTETDLACDRQLHFTIALPGVPVEGAADRKRSRRPSRNSLLAHLLRISKVASRWLF